MRLKRRRLPEAPEPEVKVRRTIGLISLILVTVTLFAGSFGVAHALGTQNHTTNGVRHGCPYDNGCTGATNYYGDYVRNGYNRCEPFPSGCTGDSDMDSSSASVYYKTTANFRASNSCSNCQRLDVYYDTNPAAECYYLTRHTVSGPSLSAHNHYTESADTAGCPL